MSKLAKALTAAAGNAASAPVGQAFYDTAGTYNWVAPDGVESVCVVCMGGASNGRCLVFGGGSTVINASAAGAGLGWINNYSVTPGNSYQVIVGAGGTSGSYSQFYSTGLVRGNPGGWGSNGGTFTGDGGGNGGNYFFAANGGGGAGGGYTGVGGTGSTGSGSAPATGSGGGYGGGYRRGGGGVGYLGRGADGASNGQGGSGGTNGSTYNGGTYGGGSATGPNTGATTYYGSGGKGFVRIIWGDGREFPDTNTGDL